jgi:membrane protein required for colicin V production
MIIDALFAILFILACIKGYQKGLIVALFSILAFLAGLAAALKLSAVVATKLSVNEVISAKWLPVISFILVFLIVGILVSLGAKLVQKSVEMVMLGWLNRLGGIVFYILLYSIVLSIFLFYAVQLHLIKNESILTSRCYYLIKPLGPGVIDKLGIIIPFFKDMFVQLQHFFDAVSNKI